MENKKSFSWEKAGVYLSCLTLIVMFWQSQDTVKDKICEDRERISKLEAKIEHLEEK
mgnify:CR=1 FL=1